MILSELLYFFHVLINGIFISVNNIFMIKLDTEIELFMLKCARIWSSHECIIRLQLFKMSSVMCAVLVTVLWRGKKCNCNLLNAKMVNPSLGKSHWERLSRMQCCICNEPHDIENWSCLFTMNVTQADPIWKSISHNNCVFKWSN